MKKLSLRFRKLQDSSLVASFLTVGCIGPVNPPKHEQIDVQRKDEPQTAQTAWKSPFPHSYPIVSRELELPPESAQANSSPTGTSGEGVSAEPVGSEPGA